MDKAVGSEGERRVGKNVHEFKSQHGQEAFFLFQFLNFFVTKRVYLGLSMQINEYLYPNNVDLTV